MVVPKYEELSVKNLYKDALQDPEISPYLPSPEQSIKKLPERDFFFNIIRAIKPDYFKQIINEANKNRNVAGDQKIEKDYIMIDDSWLDELTKHPYYSSKLLRLTHIEKPGKAIYLMKQRSRLVRISKKRTKFNVGKRLGDQSQMVVDDKDQTMIISQYRKVADLGFNHAVPVDKEIKKSQ